MCFVARDEKLGEDRVFVEATGPWSRVTWLETSMMQAYKQITMIYYNVINYNIT